MFICHLFVRFFIPAAPLLIRKSIFPRLSKTKNEDSIVKSSRWSTAPLSSKCSCYFGVLLLLNRSCGSRDWSFMQDCDVTSLCSGQSERRWSWFDPGAIFKLFRYQAEFRFVFDGETFHGKVGTERGWNYLRFLYCINKFGYVFCNISKNFILLANSFYV